MSVCLVVEDSRLARKEIIHLLDEIGVFDKILEAENAEEAAELLEAHDPEIVFLDIHLPGMNGFEFLESLDEIPKVIFTTAYDEYAIKSFDYNAIDYVLKPIKKERLEKAIGKLDLEDSKNKKSELATKQIFVRDGEKCWFVKIDNIHLIESIGNYSRIYFEDQKPLLQRSLSYLESVLDPNVFFRVNRKQIINLTYIDQLDTWFNGKLKLKLKTGEEIELSRRRSLQIKNMFSL